MAACSGAALGRHPWPSLGLQFFLIIGPRNTREESDRLERLGVVLAPCSTHESGRQAWRAGPNRAESFSTIAPANNREEPVAPGLPAARPPGPPNGLEDLRNDYAPALRVHATEVRNEAEWHHAFSGYLETPEVRDAIYARLSEQARVPLAQPRRRPGGPKT